MIASDKKRFAQLMTALGETYNRQISPQLLEIYFRALDDCAIDDIDRAVAAHLRDTRSGMFFPKPADLLKHIKPTPSEITIQDRVQVEWDGVMQNIIRYGGQRGIPKELSGCAQRVINSLGGWKYFCSLTYDQLTWKKKEFASVFEAFEKIDRDSELIENRLKLTDNKTAALKDDERERIGRRDVST